MRSPQQHSTSSRPKKPRSPHRRLLCFALENGELPLAEGIRRAEARSNEASQRAGKGKQQAEAAGVRAVGEANFKGCGRGKLLSPERRRGAVRHARETYRLSERHACRLLSSGEGHNFTKDLWDRRGWTDASDLRAGQCVRPLWLPANHNPAAGSGLVCGQPSGAEDLAAGRAKKCHRNSGPEEGYGC